MYGRFEHVVLTMGIKVVQVPGLCVPVGLEPTLGVALLNAELDAQGRCNDCHVDGSKQLSDAKCLGCHDHQDLKKRIDGSLAHFWSESYGQIYPHLARLAVQLEKHGDHSLGIRSAGRLVDDDERLAARRDPEGDAGSAGQRDATKRPLQGEVCVRGAAISIRRTSSRAGEHSTQDSRGRPGGRSCGW